MDTTQRPALGLRMNPEARLAEQVAVSRRSKQRRANDLSRLILWHVARARSNEKGSKDFSLGSTERTDHGLAAKAHWQTVALLKELTP